MLITRILFLITTAAAILLGATAFAATWLLQFEMHPSFERFNTLLAYDKIVRRTAIVCAIGLLATAWIFFRPSPDSSGDDEDDLDLANDVESKHSHKKRPGSIAGA